MTFSLTILGSSSAIPTLTRNPSAHLLTVNERCFLIDCGEGTQLQLRKFHIHFQRINRIFISHLHGDHYFGLIGLLNTLHLLGRKDELHLYGPPSLKEIIDIQLESSLTLLNYPLFFHIVSDSGYNLIHEDESITIHSFPLLHSVPTCGFIFREKKQQPIHSYAYCSDTAYTETIIPYITGCDLLYHEATFMQDMTSNAHNKFHSTTIEAATIAQKAKVKKLLIGHFSARYEDLEPLVIEARTIFPETYLAGDGEIFKL